MKLDACIPAYSLYRTRGNASDAVEEAKDGTALPQTLAVLTPGHLSLEYAGIEF